jgi:hypothetical protein
VTKFGRGLNREIVAAVNTGELLEPLSTASVLDLVNRRGWKVSPNMINVTLGNAASETHSLTFKKYFESIGRGQYRVRDEYRGLNWR